MENGPQGLRFTELSPWIHRLEDRTSSVSSTEESSVDFETTAEGDVEAMALTRRQQASGEKSVERANTNGVKKRNGSASSSLPKTPTWTYILLILFAIISVVSIPTPLHPARGEKPSVKHVFYYGWLTAISTGLGALPFYFFPKVGPFWVGVSNGTSRRVSFKIVSP